MCVFSLASLESSAEGPDTSLVRLVVSKLYQHKSGMKDSWETHINGLLTCKSLQSVPSFPGINPASHNFPSPLLSTQPPNGSGVLENPMKHRSTGRNSQWAPLQQPSQQKTSSVASESPVSQTTDRTYISAILRPLGYRVFQS